MLIPNSGFRIYHKNEDSLDFRRENLFYGNKYYFYDTFVVGECINGNLFVIDIDDYETVSQFVWNINKQGYVASSVKGKNVLQHRLIMNVLNDSQTEIDHINFDTSDNRKSNLRVATRSQNCAHQREKRNKTGIIGVFYVKKIQKWRAEISSKRRRYYLGSFKTFEEAVQARLKAEQELHGEFGINLSTISNQAANSGRLND